MSAYQEFTGKSVEEALKAAREAFKVELNDLDFEILTPGSRGVLGMGAEPARIVAAPRQALGGSAPKREAAASTPLPAAPPRDDRPRDDRAVATIGRRAATATVIGVPAGTTGPVTIARVTTGRRAATRQPRPRPPARRSPAQPTPRAAISRSATTAPAGMIARRAVTARARTARHAATAIATGRAAIELHAGRRPT